MNTPRFPLFLLLAVLAASTLTGCAAIGDVFKTGAWFGVIAVFLVVLILWWIVRKIGGNRNSS